MISDRLYALAFEYKKTKLWKILWDTEVFAVKLSGDRIGYISIMGAAHEHCALGLYIGEDGLDSFRAIMRADDWAVGPLRAQEIFFQQNCLQCALECKDMLSEEELEEAKQYARTHGIKIAGKNAYPQFVKFQPNCYPWHLQTEQEQEDLCEALAAAIEIARLLEKKAPEELGLWPVREETEEVPMLERRGGVFTLGKAKLPEERPKSWPAPAASNEIGIAKLKKAKRGGAWECEIVRLPKPVQEEPEDVPFFPVMLFAVEADTGFILPLSPVSHYEDSPEELLNLLMEALALKNICPKELKVRDERTCAFVKAFCGKLNIAIRMEENLPALDEAEAAFAASFDMSDEEAAEEAAAWLDELLELDDEQLCELPAAILEQFQMLLEQGGLPDDLEERFRQRFPDKDAGTSKPRKSKGKAEKSVSKQSYVISVSLGTGCYRHIEISCGSTLFELHSAILNAFEFDDDHAHAFFLDNRVWSDWDCYYAEGVEDGERTTDRYTLSQAGLCPGKQFKYLFDFGEEWTFQCKVLRVVEESTAEPVLLRSKGEAPGQYDPWEDE